MNKDNNVEWQLELQPSETKEITLKYVVEHPSSKKLTSYVVHPAE